jgi:hypothetical protein
LSDNDKYYIIRKRILIRKIQKYWRIAISNPDYVICRKRLLYELNELNEF